MNRYIRIDTTALEARSTYHELITPDVIRAAARTMLGLRGEFYTPLPVPGAPHDHSIVPQLELIPVGMMSGPTGWDESGKRHTWRLFIGATPGAQIYSGCEGSWTRLWAKLEEEG